MSSDTLARMHALNKKADELADKGHLLRAAENYGRAAEAARAFGPDNFVDAYMQLRQVNMFCIFSAMTTGRDAVADPPHFHDAAPSTSCVTLLSGVMAALERRRLAGTLLLGKCTAAEEAWHGGGV